MRHEIGSSLVQVVPPPGTRLLALGNILLAIGLATMAVPTMIEVAKFSWSTEQGGHGPIVLATGLWLLWRELTAAKPTIQRGKLLPGLLMMAPLIAVFVRR